VQLDAPIVVGVHRAEYAFTDVHVNVEFFPELAPERIRVAFVRVDFAARKLPHTGEVDSGLPSCHQEAMIGFDDGRDDDDHARAPRRR
jgi:hypothetical protein